MAIKTDRDIFGISEIPRETLRKILTPRELDIVTLYYLEENKYSYLEIGALFDLTRDKVRAMCSRAVRKILRYKREEENNLTLKLTQN